MENALPIIADDMRGKFLGVQVGKDVPIPRILSGDEERCSSGRLLLIDGSTFMVGNSIMNFANANHFLVVGVEKSISNSWIHRTYL